MEFTVLPVEKLPPLKVGAYLVTDNWDDWFEYSTQYALYVVDANKDKHRIGEVKIGQFSMAKAQRRPDIPDKFEVLGEEFFSIGQDDSYYERLQELGDEVRVAILASLRDIAADADLYTRAVLEPVSQTSLFRSVTEVAAQGQFRRLAMGGARLTPYEFKYKSPVVKGRIESSIILDFKVSPESNPPSNVHVIIGRNGVGKTRLLTLMTKALVEQSSESKVGTFLDDKEAAPDSLFANLVSVTFSAFDPFQAPTVREDQATGIRYSYVGLKRPINTKWAGKPKSPEMLAREFVNSVQVCVNGPKADRWMTAVETLDADPIFREAEVVQLADGAKASGVHVLRGKNKNEKLFKRAKSIFNRLSSGHKVVLLTITRLVEVAEERTLVLLDEPEAHLHPPLLSAFVRSLSDLLINRNGVAIVATHSPVVLQEVPKSCVWKLRRTGYVVKADRPELETFGENVGVLTREVFGLEVTESGFHRMLQQAVDKKKDYEEVLAIFGNRLGSEAKAIVRALIEERVNNENS
ncbi:MAG: AAA family ATPase [Planctomycetaceae bacterium]